MKEFTELSKIHESWYNEEGIIDSWFRYFDRDVATTHMNSLNRKPLDHKKTVENEINYKSWINEEINVSQESIDRVIEITSKGIKKNKLIIYPVANMMGFSGYHVSSMFKMLGLGLPPYEINPLILIDSQRTAKYEESTFRELISLKKNMKNLEKSNIIVYGTFDEHFDHLAKEWQENLEEIERKTAYQFKVCPEDMYMSFD